MNDIEYVREEDRQEYLRFAAHHLRSFGHPPVSEIWHYTDAEGLVGILKSGQLWCTQVSGQLWCTQVSCLNDSLEQRYFGDLVHAAVKARRAKNTDADIAILLRIADDSLDGRDFSAAGNFVACFSEVEDDLGQWRGYGGGQCGYSVGFRFDGILEALKARPSAFLLPMHYEDAGHQFLVGEVLRWAEQYFLRGVQRGLPVERWAREFLAAFAMQLLPFEAIIKHPKFNSEREHRILIVLQPGEHAQLEFRQRRDARVAVLQ
jgi:hypothetical protein